MIRITTRVPRMRSPTTVTSGSGYLLPIYPIFPDTHPIRRHSCARRARPRARCSPTGSFSAGSPSSARPLSRRASLRWLKCFFFRTRVPLASTRWVQSTFQASVHFNLSSPVNKSQRHQKWCRTFFRNAGNQTRVCWMRSKNAASELCSPRKCLFALDRGDKCFLACPPGPK